MPFMSMDLLLACQFGQPIIHTALDDLESFLWVLIWGIVYASKDIAGAMDGNQGIQLMLDAWSGDAKSNRLEFTIADYNWEDNAFGDLIQEWLDTTRKAQKTTKKLTRDMSEMVLKSAGWNLACDELDSYCRVVYEEVLESGFRHLEGVSEYPDWDSVVAANSPGPSKRRRT